MLLGGIVGWLTGYPFSLLAILDGFLSGLMGGMMGVMFVMMTPPENITILVKIMSVITTGILFILFLTLKNEIEISKNGLRGFLFKPSSMFLAICLFLVMIDQFHFLNDHSKHQDSTHSHFVINASEFRFSSDLLKVKPGAQITLTLVNHGKVEHDFEIEGTNIHVHALPGTQNQITFSIDKPGIYKAICTLPGHQEAGMITFLEVG